MLQVLQLFSFQVWVWILEWIPRLLAKYAYFAQYVGLAGFWLNNLKIRRKVGSIFELNDICHKAEKHTLWQMGGLSRLAYAVSEDKTWQGPTILLCPTYKAIAHVSCTSFPVKELDHQVQLGIFLNFKFPNWPSAHTPCWLWSEFPCMKTPSLFQRFAGHSSDFRHMFFFAFLIPAFQRHSYYQSGLVWNPYLWGCEVQREGQRQPAHYSRWWQT